MRGRRAREGGSPGLFSGFPRETRGKDGPGPFRSVAMYLETLLRKPSTAADHRASVSTCTEAVG